MRPARLLAIGAALTVLTGASGASAQIDPYLGQLMLYAGNFCPQGWAKAEGQFLLVAQNQALFNLIGMTYGGNGLTTFALPDLRGRAAIHTAAGPNPPALALGQQLGTDSVTMTMSSLPTHTHTLTASEKEGTQGSPDGATLGVFATSKVYAAPANAAIMVPLEPAGGAQPIDQHQPSLSVGYCIALQGQAP